MDAAGKPITITEKEFKEYGKNVKASSIVGWEYGKSLYCR